MGGTAIHDITVDTDTYLAHRDELTGWLEAHGLEPGVIPLGSTIRIAGDTVTVVEQLRNEDGRFYVDPTTRTLAQTTRTVPLVRPWPLPPATATDSWTVGGP